MLPLVCRQTVNIIDAGENFNDTTELSTFGFLYGTFPAAPGAFVIATQYNVEVELVCSLNNKSIKFNLIHSLCSLADCTQHGALHIHLGATYVYLGQNDIVDKSKALGLLA